MVDGRAGQLPNQAVSTVINAVQGCHGQKVCGIFPRQPVVWVASQSLRWSTISSSRWLHQIGSSIVLLHSLTSDRSLPREHRTTLGNQHGSCPSSFSGCRGFVQHHQMVRGVSLKPPRLSGRPLRLGCHEAAQGQGRGPCLNQSFFLWRQKKLCPGFGDGCRVIQKPARCRDGDGAATMTPPAVKSKEEGEC